MEYLKPKFTLPTCGSRVSQERWDEIFGSTENKELTTPQIAPGLDMSGPKHFGIPEHPALSQADGWASDGQMAGGTRDRV